jgi:hypothetical protein
MLHEFKRNYGRSACVTVDKRHGHSVQHLAGTA